MRTCISCQDMKEDNDVDSKYDRCSMCMGYKIAEDNMNLIIPVLNRLGIEYKKETWGSGEGCCLDLDKGIFLHFANAGGIYFEYDKDAVQEKAE